MINLLLGAPGSGKSYEAVSYHVIPALVEGRAVVTNLPLNVSEIAQVVPGADALVTILEPTAENPRPFSRVQDYTGHAWRDEETGRGPLFVIDECHMALPRGATPREVEEWYAMHRHTGADVLLISQSYRKLSQAVVDLVQTVYRVRKNVALGSTSSYVRKVQDGVRGEVVNTSIRKYHPKYFRYYKSHTLTNSAVQEAMAKDVKGIWSHWSFKALAVLAAFLVYWVSTHNVNPFQSVQAIPEKSTSASPGVSVGSPGHPAPGASSMSSSSHVASSGPGNPAAASSAPPEPPAHHPFERVSLHITGYMQKAGYRLYQVRAGYNGQPSFDLTSDQLIEAGYQVEAISECLARLSYGAWSYYVICDAPTTGPVMAGQQTSRQGEGDASDDSQVVQSPSGPGEYVQVQVPGNAPSDYRPGMLPWVP